MAQYVRGALMYTKPKSLGSKFTNGGSMLHQAPPLMILIYKYKRGCTNNPQTLGSKFRNGRFFRSPSPPLMLLIYKRGCNNEKNSCTNDPENLGPKLKNGVSGKMYLRCSPPLYLIQRRGISAVEMLTRHQ